MASGLSIKIEYRRGQTRTGVDASGKEWARKMHADYGHIKNTEGTDGDEIDVYVGPDKAADTVYAITQLKAPEFKKFDEQKFMLGFKDAAAAKTCYLKHYPDPQIFGGMKAMPVEEFEAKAMSDKNQGKKIAADQRRFVEMNLHLMPRGEKVAASHVMGGAQAAELSAQFSSERGTPSPFVSDFRGSDFAQYPRPRGGGTSVRFRSGSGYGFKTAAKEPRHVGIEDRLDDVGLTILAAPYAARGVANVLEHRGGRVGAVGKAARKAADFLHHHENKTELAGLALVAPGVIKPMARGIDKVLPKEKKATLADLDTAQFIALEKVAMQYVPDFEYMTEAEKLASMASMLGAGVGTAVRAGRGVARNVGEAVGGVKALGNRMSSGIKNMASQARAGMHGIADEARQGFAQAQHASKIRGVQRQLDYRQGFNQATGARPYVPGQGKAATTGGHAAAQRIADRRQAVEQMRQEKGLGTSAERAAANRAAKAGPIQATTTAPATPVAAQAPAQKAAPRLPAPPQVQVAPAAAGGLPKAPAAATPGAAAPQRPVVNPGLQARLDSRRAAANPVSPTPMPAAAPAPRVMPGTVPNTRGQAPAGKNPYAWGRGGTQADSGIPQMAAMGMGVGAAALANQQKEAALYVAKLAAAASYARPKPGFLDGLLGSAAAAAKRGKPNARSAPAHLSSVQQARPQPGLFSRLTGGGVATNTAATGRVPPKATGSLPKAQVAAIPRVAAGAAGAGAAAAPLISGKTIAKAVGIGTLGLGLYAGKKVIDVGADLAGGERRIEPAPTPDYGSVVR